MTTPRFGLLSYPGAYNLGDAIQSLAAKRFLPRVDARIAREELSQKPDIDAPLRLIANGWFMDNPRNWPPHPMIEPLLISMHFAETDFRRFQRWRKRPLDILLAGAGGEYLRAHGPVGARDLFTQEELDKRGIEAYLSGCLTLTLQRPAGLPSEDFIVACDLTPPQLAHLRAATSRAVIETSHTPGGSRDALERERDAEDALAVYARAAAVVTTRIHAALPCLALGTPVLLLQSPDQGRRVSDVAALMRSVSAVDFLRSRYDFDFATPPANPDSFRPLAARLEAACTTFVETERQ